MRLVKGTFRGNSPVRVESALLEAQSVDRGLFMDELEAENNDQRSSGVRPRNEDPVSPTASS